MADSRLRKLAAERRALLVPGVYSALTARQVELAGFEAVYVTGAGVANALLAAPDLGLTSFKEVLDQVQYIVDAVEVPVIVDADTGFGNAVSAGRVVRLLERAGAAAAQLEDQEFPKRCGHFDGKQIISTEEMVGKIKAAVDARQDESLQIIARTAARAVLGFDAALERAGRYAEAGADILFVEAPESEAEIRALPGLVKRPQLVNVVVGGKTPVLGFEELKAAGFALVLYANAALQGAVLGMQLVLRQLREQGRLDERAPLASFAERQRLVQKDFFDALDNEYSGV